MAFSFKIIHFLHFLPLLIFFQCLLQLGFYIFPQLFRFQYRHIRGEALGEVGGGYLVGVDQNGHRFLCFVRKHHILAEQVDHIADQRPTDPEHRPAVAAVIQLFHQFPHRLYGMCRENSKLSISSRSSPSVNSRLR